MTRDQLQELQRRWGAGEYNNEIRGQISRALDLLLGFMPTRNSDELVDHDNNSATQPVVRSVKKQNAGRSRLRAALGLVIVLCAAIGVAGTAVAYDDHDYCLGEARAERTDCRGLYWSDVATCLDAYNLARWIEDDQADADLLDCKATALDNKAFCWSLIDTCEE